MLYVSEQTVIDLVSQQQVTAAVESAFAAIADGRARNFPVIRETLDYADAIFGFKSGFDRSGPLLGIKAGGLWPGNAAIGLPNHQSTILLFDPDTGEPEALVRGTYLTALRTAAASALSIRHLAREDAESLGIIGAGGQALHQVKAALAEREFRVLRICDRSQRQAQALAGALERTVAAIEICEPEELVRASDVIITMTPSTKPIVRADWVEPGTQIACMGADTKGKQELETLIVANSSVFGDAAAQAIEIGECQHAYREGSLSEQSIVSIGNVINGDHPGRQNTDELTLFDSTGVALQDFAAARVALDLAAEHKKTVRLS